MTVLLIAGVVFWFSFVVTSSYFQCLAFISFNFVSFMCFLISRSLCPPFIEFSVSMRRKAADNKSIVVVRCVYAMLDSSRLRIRMLYYTTTADLLFNNLN